MNVNTKGHLDGAQHRSLSHPWQLCLAGCPIKIHKWEVSEGSCPCCFCLLESELYVSESKHFSAQGNAIRVKCVKLVRYCKSSSNFCKVVSITAAI